MQAVLDVQMPIMKWQFEKAQQNQTRYEDVFQPIEDDLIAEFQGYDTPQRQELEAGKNIAMVTQAAEQNRANNEQRLAGLGIDPSQLRSQAIDTQFQVGTAAAQAAAANQGRTQVENEGRVLRAAAIDIGRGLPGNVAQNLAMVNQTGGQVTGATNAAAGNAVAGMGNATGQSIGVGNSAYGNLASSMQGFNAGTSGILNAQSGALNAYNAGTGARGNGLSGLGASNGFGLSGYGSFQSGMNNAGNGYMNNANILNSGYNNQMNQYSNTTGFMDIAGLAAGMGASYLMGGFAGKDGGSVRAANGGAIPTNNTYTPDGEIVGPGGPRDDGIQARLSDGEFIVPEHTVRYFGTKKLNQMLQESEEKGREIRQVARLCI
jgi:hypothetical protein